MPQLGSRGQTPVRLPAYSPCLSRLVASLPAIQKQEKHAVDSKRDPTFRRGLPPSPILRQLLCVHPFVRKPDKGCSGPCHRRDDSRLSFGAAQWHGRTRRAYTKYLTGGLRSGPTLGRADLLVTLHRDVPLH